MLCSCSTHRQCGPESHFVAPHISAPFSVAHDVWSHAAAMPVRGKRKGRDTIVCRRARIARDPYCISAA